MNIIIIIGFVIITAMLFYITNQINKIKINSEPYIMKPEIQREDESYIAKLLYISPLHFSPESIQYIKNQIKTKDYCITAYNNRCYQYMLYIPPKPEIQELKSMLPTELYTIMLFAEKQNCRWMIIDEQEKIITTLPIYKEEWTEIKGQELLSYDTNCIT